MPATNSSKRVARPTVAQACALIKQLNAAQRYKVLRQLQAELQAEVRAASLEVAERIREAGEIITEQDIAAEVRAVRSERYAAGQR